MYQSTDYIATLPAFLAYFAISIAMLAAFITIYVWITPYKEFAMIKAGNNAPAITLAGAVIGFVLPLNALVKAAVNVEDLLIWGGIILIVQVLAFLITNLLFRQLKQNIIDGQISSAIFLAMISLAVGMLNAACVGY